MNNKPHSTKKSNGPSSTDKKPTKKRPGARHQARLLTLQALYAWQVNPTEKQALIEQSLIEYQNQYTDKLDQAYFTVLINGVLAKIGELDKIIIPVLDRDINQLMPIELAALRLAVYELTERLDVPYKVVINEALELTKTFGSVEGYKYVNGVLDKLARGLREA